jgi:DNA-binding NarL/FixJ family response regulator
MDKITGERPVRVLVVVDPSLMRSDLATSSLVAPEIEVVAEVTDVASAAETYARHRPDRMLVLLGTRTTSAADLVAAVRRSHPDANVEVLTGLHNNGAGDGTSLTARQTAILGLLAKGRSNRDIASTLFISEATVKHDLQHIYIRLGVSDRTEAAVLAVRRGIIEG